MTKRWHVIAAGLIAALALEGPGPARAAPSGPQSPRLTPAWQARNERVKKLRAGVRAQRRALDDLSADIDDKKREIEDLAIPDLESELARRQREVAELGSALATTREREAQLETQSRAYRVDARQTAIQASLDFSFDIRRAKERLAAIEQELANLSIGATLDGSLAPRVPEKRAEVEAARAEVARLERERDAADGESRGSLADAEQAFSDEALRLQTDREAMQREAQDTELARRELATRLDAARKERTRKEAELTALVRRYDADKAAADSAQSLLQEEERALASEAPR